MVKALSSSEYLNMAGVNFQIYIVQITRKCICKAPPPPLAWSDH